MSHAINRTSPKGQPFIGTCFKCGIKNLTIENLHDDCANVRALTNEESIIEAITGDYEEPKAPVIQLTGASFAHRGP